MAAVHRPRLPLGELPRLRVERGGELLEGGELERGGGRLPT
jgi:hypothetical protein